MSITKAIWVSNPSFKRILLRVESRNWLLRSNWKFNSNLDAQHFNIITPLLHCTKCNGEFTIGIGNIYLVIGW